MSERRRATRRPPAERLRPPAHAPAAPARRSLFGWQNVRGAAYCRTTMRGPPAPLADFKRDPTRAFDYLTRREVDDIVAVVQDLAEEYNAMSDDSACSASRASSPGVV